MDRPERQGGLHSISRVHPQTYYLQNGLPLYVYHLASLSPIQKELDAVPSERRYQRMYVPDILYVFDIIHASAQSRAVRVHDSLCLPPLLLPPSPQPHDTHLLYHNHHRPQRRLNRLHVVAAEPPPGGVTSRDSKLSRNT